MRRRNIKKQIWLSEEENILLNNSSIEYGLTESDVIRMYIKKYIPKVKPSEEFYMALRDLRGIGTNLNQLAHIANTYHTLDYKLLKEELDKLNEFIELMKDNYLRPSIEKNVKIFQ